MFLSAHTSYASPVSDPGLEVAALQPLVRAVVAAVLREHPHHSDVDDCTHEAMRRAIEAPERARGPLRPYLMGIARNVALDARRARAKAMARTASTREPTDSQPDVLDRLASPEAPQDEQLDQARRAAVLRQALTSLDEGPRRALEAFHLRARSYREIADELGVPVGTVATWVLRGRKALALALEPELFAEGGLR